MLPVSTMESHRAKKISNDHKTKRGHSSEPIPLDLIPTILKGLPVKTLARFLAVSKQWESMIRNRDFVKSYLNKSSNRPQGLFFTFESHQYFGKRFFFSSGHPENQGEGASSSLLTFHMNCHHQPYNTVAPSVHGLICYGPPSKLKVYNPSTRRTITLPKMDSQRIDMYHYLGYDPIDGVYKVLCMTKGPDVGGRRGLAQEVRVLTIGDEDSWRMIEDFPSHTPETAEICIGRVLYYGAFLEKESINVGEYQAVMSFDLRSENLHLIKIPESATFTKLISYEGKLALVCTGYIGLDASARIDLLVLEDAAKHDWSSKSFSVLPSLNKRGNAVSVQVFCATDAGEFVSAPQRLGERKLCYVLYYDPKTGSVRRVNIEGLTDLKIPLWDECSDLQTISVFPSQVENLMFL